MADFLILDNNKKNVDNVDNKKNWDFTDKINSFVYSFTKIKTKEKVSFYRLMSTMLNSWLTLVNAVKVLERQQKKWNFKRILSDFQTNLSSWKKLSECMEEYPDDFTAAEIWMIKSWEKTWKLNQTLLELAIQTERLASITWKIKSAMMYPAAIILVVVWVIYVIMTKVVPNLMEVFGDKSALPQSTKNLIFVSDLMSNQGYIFILLFIAIYIFIFFWRKTPNWAYIYDEFVFKVPVFWQMLKKIILSKFARIFSWLIGSWISVVESLKITAEAVWNEVYKQRILLLTEDVGSWIKIWESLDGDKLFPDMMIQMIQVWEETAKLEETILKVSDYYDEEVDNIISNINKLLEPFIIITLAIIVWFIAMSILEPIMNMADTISG